MFFFVSNKSYATVFASLSIGKSELVLILIFSSGDTKEGCMLCLDGRGVLDE